MHVQVPGFKVSQAEKIDKYMKLKISVSVHVCINMCVGVYKYAHIHGIGLIGESKM